LGEQDRPTSHNDTFLDRCSCPFIPDLVAEQARTRPDALAVSADGTSITYRELELQAGRLAHHLQMRGVKSEQLVVLCLEPSIESAISALAVLKIGGAYVPLDPSWPMDRLRFMLNDCGTPLVVTDGRVGASLPSGRWQVLDLDLEREAIDYSPPFYPHASPSGERLAYVIYTSGSTGRPKGVEITVAGLMNLIFWHQRAFRVEPSDRATLLASPGFDAAVWELWPYLCAGASLHVPADQLRSSPEGLRDWLVAQRITITFVPTPLAELMVGLSWPPDCRLRCMLTGGDRLYRHPPKGLPFQLVNNYGPTECTVVATSGVVAPGTDPGKQPTIGHPITNTQILILDENLTPVPAGSIGELHIGGPGVARGYLNQPELTAEKFIRVPLTGGLGSRLYKSGDLARYLPSGEIEFVGRRDDQVKIRGYRIELGEVVATLNRHSSIQASHVIVRKDGVEKDLIAYIVPAPGSRPAAGELREFLLTQLPPYMVPANFVLLDSMPLSSSGKVDRQALPSPDESNLLVSNPYAPAQTATEERVAAIVAGLLGLPRVGAEDNFFALGGHSLLAVQLILRISEVFGVDVSMLSLFEAPTVVNLAHEVEQLLMADAEMKRDEGMPLRVEGLPAL
jgi:amino acid adenylation domain-containing protein